ncbi:hypothetical protein [Sediminibacter sp. Hel_I_10]|uniref:hypothetical protein n=1 Tax=Sediminibacter sp. Hel_I_10 TaxID=1392490 RepID=UPI00055A296F|nr:hypothetical protein [Sediminibacter sp. Hel_I_10]
MNFTLRPFLTALLIFFVITCSFSQSQSQHRESQIVNYAENIAAPLSSSELSKIKEVYGDKAEKYVLSKPQRLKDIKNILRNRIEFITVQNPQDQKDCELLSEVPLFNYYVSGLKRDDTVSIETFNPLKYLFNYNSIGNHIYRIDNTNQYILVKSQFNN